ncbi:GTPase IMAP family member 9-like [Littorina saxatilis]|uniref:GTPase IMAP family member 9-like n=1 Tax=Littorina saxatilis TaxID=31220 RepID=UPI0038B585CB
MFQDLTEMAEEEERRWLLAEDSVNLFDGCLHDMTSDEYRVILVGKTGSGKSSVGNRLLNRPDIVAPFPGSAAATPRTQEWADYSVDPYDQGGFVVSPWPYTCTIDCRYNEGRAWGKELKVIDTPGIFATSEDVKHTLIELTRCMALSAPGPQAIIFVVRLDSTFTPEEQDVFDKILKIFGEKVTEYMIIAFTHGEILDNHRSDADVQRLVSMIPNLQTVLQSVHYRYVIFCNTPTRQEEAVRELLQKIDQLKKQSSCPHFVNDTLSKQAEVIEERVRKLTQKRPDLTDAEVLSEVRRQIARSDDTKKFALKLLGGAPQDFSRLWI